MSEPRSTDDLRQEGIARRLDEIIRLLRRVDCRLSGERIPDNIKDLVFDEAGPNGRLI